MNPNPKAVKRVRFGPRYLYTTQRAVRRAFWLTFPHLRTRRAKGADYPTETRVTFCDWIDTLERDGYISQALSYRVTL